MSLINSTYEHKLAYIFHQIDKRGLVIDTQELAAVSSYVNSSICSMLDSVSVLAGEILYLGKAAKGVKGTNINSPVQLMACLKSLGYTIPKLRKKNPGTKEIEYKESTEELAMQKILTNPALLPKGANVTNANQLIRTLLDIKEYSTFKNRYINALLFENMRLKESYYLCNYNVAGTTSGRRSSRKNLFGFGNNSQNFPKHSELGKKYRKCITSPTGKLFLIVDQISAEDWPVQALAANDEALRELRSGVNRHEKLAAFMFGLTLDQMKTRRKDPNDSEADLYYFLGKKTRHSNNYGVRGQTMSEGIAKEGYVYSKYQCDELLRLVNIAEPTVESIFHEYIRREVFSKKLLTTPLGRERQFFGVRQGDKNYSVLNEAYSYIPQSIVGDNTGLGISEIHSSGGFVVQDGHDSVVQEFEDNEKEVIRVGAFTRRAFDRNIQFHNGLEINIPIEGEIGYNWAETIKIKPFTDENIQKAYVELKEKYSGKKT